MSKAISQVPFAVNEPVNSYAPGTPEVKSLIAQYKKMWAEKIEIPMIINECNSKAIEFQFDAINYISLLNNIGYYHSN